MACSRASPPLRSPGRSSCARCRRSLLTRGAALSSASSSATGTNAPSVAITLATVLLPIALMLSATVVTTVLKGGDVGAAWKLLATWVAFVGNPSVALLVGTLVAT